MNGSTPRRGNRCDCHCRACGQHFASLAAFDAHHRREVENGPSLGCLAGEDAGLEARFDGVCGVSGEAPITGVIVYGRSTPVRVVSTTEVIFAEEPA